VKCADPARRQDSRRAFPLLNRDALTLFCAGRFSWFVVPVFSDLLRAPDRVDHDHRTHGQRRGQEAKEDRPAHGGDGWEGAVPRRAIRLRRAPSHCRSAVGPYQGTLLAMPARTRVASSEYRPGPARNLAGASSLVHPWERANTPPNHRRRARRPALTPPMRLNRSRSSREATSAGAGPLSVNGLG